MSELLLVCVVASLVIGSLGILLLFVVIPYVLNRWGGSRETLERD